MHVHLRPDINAQEFAIAITMPGAGGAEIVNASIRHNVHILNKEAYRKDKDYSVLLGSSTEDNAIILLFIFKDGSSVSVSSYAHLVEVIADLESTADATLS